VVNGEMRPVTLGVSSNDGSKQEEDMRHRKIKIAAIAIAAAAGVSGIVDAAVVEGSGSAMTPAASSIAVIVPATSPATIHAQGAMVGGQTETVLVDAQGLPTTATSSTRSPTTAQVTYQGKEYRTSS
jgi:hypothetical protein